MQCFHQQQSYSLSFSYFHYILYILITIHMYRFKQLFTPIVDEYNRWLKDPYMTDISQIKGGSSIGNDFVSKHFKTHIHYAREKFVGLQRRYDSVDFADLLTDNWFRLFLLNGFQRLVTLRQAYPVLKSRFIRPDSLSYSLTEITQAGFLKGWLRGVSFSFLQFLGVTFPALYCANESSKQKKFASFVGYYTFFDILLYPVDRLKTILYSDTIGKYGTPSETFKLVHSQLLYNGLAFKLLFNIPLLWTYYTSVADVSTQERGLSWLALAALYPLNSLKVRHQLINSGLSFNTNETMSLQTPRGLFRGLLPFLLLNGLANYTFYNFYSQNQLAQSYTEFTKEATRFSNSN